MVNESSRLITALLKKWSNGDEYALEELMPLVYEDMRQMARKLIRRQPSGHTFQTTDLIHEAYLKFFAQEQNDWQNRSHFFCVAAKAMRHIMIDYARSKSTKKRGGWQKQITFAEDAEILSGRSDKMIALDDALNRLAKLDKRKTQVVEMKFFGGLTVEEIGEVLKISPKTVKRDWSFARTWLLRELERAK